MEIEISRAEFKDIESMRGLYRHEADCQIIHDSILGRGMADAYVIFVDGLMSGYGGVWNKYDPGQLMEFYLLPHLRHKASPIYRRLLVASGATRLEAQTNMPLMLGMFYDYARNIRVENLLFADAGETHLPCPGGVFRRATTEEAASVESEWIVEAEGKIVAHGGFLCHYNPPYGDIYMGVNEAARRQGYGSYIVQELKRVCYEAGKRPAARCNATNASSRRTLEKAGMHPCGRMLAGDVDAEAIAAAEKVEQA